MSQPLILQIHRTALKGLRTCSANYNCKQTADGSWSVRFTADYVPTEEWTNVSDGELLRRIDVSIQTWAKTLSSKVQA